MMHRKAVLSECGRFRYSLIREWDIARPSVCFVMLNPSTADAEKDDPTVRKCIGFAERLGFGRLEVVNLKAWRSTSPQGFKNWEAGPDNSWHVCRATMSAHMTICAWGRVAPQVDAANMLSRLRIWGLVPHALRASPDGTPHHPLMLPYTCKPFPIP